MAREWGPWTSIKLDALERYLSAFNVASKKAVGTLYLDLCAGAPDNIERVTGETIEGSAIRALRVEPGFSKLVFAEKSSAAAAGLDQRLRAQFPDRDFLVLPADCNQAMPQALAKLERGWRMAPAFAFLDQYSAQIDWDTVASLAAFRSGRWKVEQWIYFGDSFYPRGLAGPHGAKNVAFAGRLDAMFGCRTWREIYAARDDGFITKANARLEMVNLYRWRLQHDLGYLHARPLEVLNEQGQHIYSLIFATDHDVGNTIMESVFHLARDDLKEMLQKKRKRTAHEQRFGDAVPKGLFEAEKYLAVPEDPRIPLAVSDPKEPFRYDRQWSEFD